MPQVLVLGAISLAWMWSDLGDDEARRKEVVKWILRLSTIPAFAAFAVIWTWRSRSRGSQDDSVEELHHLVKMEELTSLV